MKFVKIKTEFCMRLGITRFFSILICNNRAHYITRANYSNYCHYQWQTKWFDHFTITTKIKGVQIIKFNSYLSEIDGFSNTQCNTFLPETERKEKYFELDCILNAKILCRCIERLNICHNKYSHFFRSFWIIYYDNVVIMIDVHIFYTKDI